MAQSGNRPPRRGQRTTPGNQAASNGNPSPANGADSSAAERARERLAQRSTTGQKRQTASQRARSAPAAPRTKAQGGAAQRERPGGPSSRRAPARGAKQRSTAMTAAIFGTVLVVLVVLVIVLVGVTGSKGGGNTSGQLGVKTAPADVVSALTGAPASAFTAAGSTASSSGPFLQFLSAPKKQPPLTQGGKPVVVYLGSNWCPYCGATRWPLTVALSRFGTFKNLKITSSSSSDVDPSTNTLSYYKSSYTSPYIVFLPTEQCTNIASSSSSAAVRACNGYEPLPGPFSKLAVKTFKKYDFAPFQTGGTNGNSGGIPFIDFGNKVVEDGAFIDPAILSGQSHLQIAQSLSDPVANPGQTILVGANYYSALICNMTNNRPGSVCDMPVVKNAAKALKAEKLLP